MDFAKNVRALRRSSLRGASIHIAMLVTLLVALYVALREVCWRYLQRQTAGSGITALILMIVEIGLLWHLTRAVALNATTRPRVVPYFPEKYFNRKTAEESRAAFGGGYHIATELRQLDELAELVGVAPLSSFGFADDLLKQQLRWHKLDDGIRTVTALIEAGTNLGRDTLSDLAALAVALKKASENQSRFSLLARYGKDDFISGVEMHRRQGTFWF